MIIKKKKVAIWLAVVDYFKKHHDTELTGYRLHMLLHVIKKVKGDQKFDGVGWGSDERARGSK